MLASTLRLAETHKTSCEFNKNKSCYIKTGAEKDTGHKVTIRFHTPDYKEICPVEMIKHKQNRQENYDNQKKDLLYLQSKQRKAINREVSKAIHEIMDNARIVKFYSVTTVKQYEKINQVKITIPTQFKDAKVKPLNKLQRPYFSPKLGSWEIDLVFGVNPVTQKRQHYLFAININTKYLVVILLILDEKNATYILAALKKLINQVYVNNI
ncbi:MAG: hypothetical protein EZS28_027483 [Streblomastix strix]|uniref:Integrase catalytic domain-containing protein n=1 Tax=Streblomastix strix TaxID=222440 RepID=A0A5J4V3Q3_9EUKA|nr:MAG: hypothetical protein EZS28_027483 [Streblomastix strix]